jgi:hypothetical protein
MAAGVLNELQSSMMVLTRCVGAEGTAQPERYAASAQLAPNFD